VIFIAGLPACSSVCLVWRSRTLFELRIGRPHSTVNVGYEY